MRAIVAYIGLFLIAPLANAQVNITNSCPADAPITLQLSAIQNNSVSVTITNISTKPITGMILRVTVTDSVGASYTEADTVDYAPSGITFEPGKATQTDVNLALAQGHTLKNADIGCLAVLYRGKDLWGDAKAPEVVRLRALRQGIATERQRLLAIYTKEGAAKLAEELNRPIVR
jgi:hypothetical protein